MCSCGFHFLLSEPLKAIEHYEQALKISREIGDRRGEGNSLGNLGLVYAELDQIPQAIECAKSALTILEAIESPHAEKVKRKLQEWEEASSQIQ
jgi:tetratricopeptide (TPR) repeat protein